MRLGSLFTLAGRRRDRPTGLTKVLDTLSCGPRNGIGTGRYSKSLKYVRQQFFKSPPFDFCGNLTEMLEIGGDQVRNESSSVEVLWTASRGFLLGGKIVCLGAEAIS